MQPTPDHWRLVKSAQSAIPFTPNFWSDWARGLAMSEDRLRGLLGELYDAGAVEGIHAESNPAHPRADEVLVLGSGEIPPGTVVRWKSHNAASVLRWKDVTPGPLRGVESRQWTKVGLMQDPPPTTGRASLLAPGTERTPVVREDEKVVDELITSRAARLLMLLSRPARILPSESPWQWYAERLRDGATAEEARRSIVELVLSRRCRRFALKVNPARLGFKGAGLACWRLDDDQAPLAAAALANVAGTGDVAVRRFAPEFSFNLVALLLGREEGAGEDAARMISLQWGRELGRWIDVDFQATVE